MKKKVTFNSVQYTSKFINANFRIKAHGLNALGEKINTLVGVSGAIALIGAELMDFQEYLHKKPFSPRHHG